MDMRPKDTLHYYDAFGEGEAIRMALYYAHRGDEDDYVWKDKRYSSEEWENMSKEKFEFQQLPMLELKNGTRLVKTAAILDFLGNHHDLKPQDAGLNYYGLKACEWYQHDLIDKLVAPVLLDHDQAKRDANIKKLTQETIPS